MKSDLEKLKAIVEASKKLTSVLDLDELLNVILDVALDELEAERGTVFLLDHEKGEILSCVLCADEIDELRLPIGKGIAGSVAETGETLIIPDAYADSRFNPDVDRSSGFRTKSILCLPMRKGDEIIGVLELLNKREGTFTSNDADYLEALAAHMVIAIENAKAHLERLEQERTRQELELAARIQRRLLPQSLPEVPGLRIAVRAEPCRAVGGDYYDFLALPGDRLGVVIADVSGKGVGAALITSALHAFLHALVCSYSGPAELASSVNRLIHDSILASSFLTMAFVEIDPRLGRLRYCNCGHNQPVFFSDGKPRLLETTGTIVGMFPHAEFGEQALELKGSEGGESLLLYTDGLTEAARGEGDEREEFGLRRLLRVCGEAPGDPASWLASIGEAVEGFTSGATFDDDLTIIAIRFDGQRN